MSLSSFSLILGAVYYIFGLPLVFTDKKFTEWMSGVFKDDDLIRIFAFPTICIAVTTLGRQPTITPDAEGLLVALAWVTLLKGLTMAWWTTNLSAFNNKILDFLLSSHAMQIIFGSVLVVLGACFTYLGLIVT